MDFLRMFIPAIHKEGVVFVVIALCVVILMSFISSGLTLFTAFIAIFIVFFFRDPIRHTPVGNNFIISPADGLITDISEAILPESLGFDGVKKATRISIFLSVFDVHVNRIPADGKIKALHYHHGKFFNAALDKASIHNERQEVLMEMKDGKEIVFTQIAGLIARRIVCDLKLNQEVKSGERYGIIRFGSRVDVYLPENVIPQVFIGQRVRGAETILADINDHSQRISEVR